jgi:hypothetical protein
VGAADGVEAVILVGFQLPVLRLVKARRAEDAVVVVQAAAAELHRAAVEDKAVLRVHRDGAHAEDRFRPVQHIAVFGDQCRLDLVEIGVVDVPELCVFHAKLCPAALRLARRNEDADLAPRGAVFDREIHPAAEIPRCVVFHRRLGDDKGVAVQDMVGVQIQPVGGQVRRRRVKQKHVAVDAAAGIPAGVGLVVVRDRDGQTVDHAELELRREIDGEGRIAIVVQAHAVAVEAHAGLAEDAVEINQYPLPFPVRGDVQLLGVGIGSAVVIAGIGAVFTLWIDVSLDHEVVGQRHWTGLHRHHRDTGGLALLDRPAEVDLRSFHFPSSLIRRSLFRDRSFRLR